MPLTVIFTRHGESQANLDGVFANRPDAPGNLTPAGVAGARALARSLHDSGVTHVYSSPLRRASQTADIISGMLGVPVTITDALREYDVGDYEGLPYTGEHAWRMERYWQVEQHWSAGNHQARHLGGESLADLLDRFLPSMADIPEQHGENDAVVAMGHGGLYRLVLPYLFATESALPETISMRHGDMILAVYDAGGWSFSNWITADTT